MSCRYSITVATVMAIIISVRADLKNLNTEGFVGMEVKKDNSFISLGAMAWMHMTAIDLVALAVNVKCVGWLVGWLVVCVFAKILGELLKLAAE